MPGIVITFNFQLLSTFNPFSASSPRYRTTNFPLDSTLSLTLTV